MKEVKRRLETFSFYDRSGLEAHLVKMAARGWLPEKIGRAVWTYRKIEPKKLSFSVCYFPEATQFDPGPSEGQETFYDFCAHTGWILAAANAQLQVFYNEREDPVPIETDPVLEVEAIHRAMERSVLPSYLVLLVIFGFFAGLWVWQLAVNPVALLASASQQFAGICWLECILLMAVELLSYYRWHKKAVQAAQRGEFLKSRSRRTLQTAALLFLGVLVVYYFLTLASAGNRIGIVMAVISYCIFILVTTLVPDGVKGLLKRKKVSANVNRAATIASVFVAGYAIMGAVMFVVLFGSSNGWFAWDEQTYEYRGQTFTARSDQLPLAVEDLVDVDYEGYTREFHTVQSLLLAQHKAAQKPRFDAEHYKEMPRLEYTVTVVKASFLYDMCKNSLLHSKAKDWNQGMPAGTWYLYEPADAAPWGAEEAYRWTSQEYGPGNTFLLCWPDRLVEIKFDSDWQLTPEQMALVAEKLGSGAL